MPKLYYTLSCPICDKVEAHDFEGDEFFALPTMHCPCLVSSVRCVWEWHANESDRDKRARALDATSKAMAAVGDQLPGSNPDA